MSNHHSPDDTSSPVPLDQGDQAGRSGRFRLRLAQLSGGAVALATIAYVVGLALSDQSPGNCTAWPGCTASAAEQWYWDEGVLLKQLMVVASALVASAYVWPWLMAQPSARFRLSVLALVGVVPLSVLLLVFAAQVRDNSCDEAGWICYGGPDQAADIATVGYVGLAIGLLLFVGLFEPGRFFARCSSLGLALVTAILVSVVGVRLADVALAALSQPFLP